MPTLASQLPKDLVAATAASCRDRIASLRNYRLSWWTHWAALAAVMLPRRYRWFITPNNYSRGSPINSQMIDETAAIAGRTLATGLLANLTSPNKPWFKLGLHGIQIDPESNAAKWLDDCTKRMLDVYAGSNIYNMLGSAYHDNSIFGSAALIQYEDKDRVVHFVNPELGGFFFGLNAKLEVDTLYREYTYTVAETVEAFGLENCSQSIQTSFKSGGSGLDLEVVIGCAIQPNTDIYRSGKNFGPLLPSLFSYAEIYWEQWNSVTKSNGETVLKIAGYREKPFVGLRWDVTSNDAYGRSPGMDALPATRQLQVEQARKGEAIDKMVRPPMVGSIAMKNEPASILPGGITYTPDPKADGFKPAFQVEPRIAEMMEDLKEVQDRIRTIFFNQLFTGITDLDTVRTATDIEARVQEKLLLLGPVVERTENEGLDDIIHRTFAIMARRNLFSPPPPEIAGMVINVEYISILAQAQRAAETASIERLFAFAGNLVGVWPQAGDNLDPDTGIENYAALVNAPPTIVRPSDAVAALRAQRDAAAQAQAGMQTGLALAQGAKTLSDTDVGGGQNALQSVTGQAA